MKRQLEQSFDFRTKYIKEDHCKVLLYHYAVPNEKTRIPQICIEVHSDDGEPLIRATTNVPEASIPNGETTYIKDYSENEGVLRELVGHGIVRETGKVITAGHAELHEVEVLVPLYD